MPIDSEERRSVIAQVAIDLIAREGLAAATFRRIAAEGGWSTASITNYFIDKQDVLVWTYRCLSRAGEIEFDRAVADQPADPFAALLTMIPWCPANQRRWKAYLAFWDAAMRDAELAALLADSTLSGTKMLERIVRAVAPARDDGEAAALVSALIQGLALRMLVDRSTWSEDEARALLARTLSPLRASVSFEVSASCREDALHR